MLSSYIQHNNNVSVDYEPVFMHPTSISLKIHEQFSHLANIETVYLNPTINILLHNRFTIVKPVKVTIKPNMMQSYWLTDIFYICCTYRKE